MQTVSDAIGVALRDLLAKERQLIDELRHLVDEYVGLAVIGPVRHHIVGRGYATSVDDEVVYGIALGKEMGYVAVTIGFIDGRGTILYANDCEPDDDSYGVMARLAGALRGRVVAVNWPRDQFTIEVYSRKLAEAQDAVRTDG